MGTAARKMKKPHRLEVLIRDVLDSQSLLANLRCDRLQGAFFRVFPELLAVALTLAACVVFSGSPPRLISIDSTSYSVFYQAKSYCPRHPIGVPAGTFF